MTTQTFNFGGVTAALADSDNYALEISVSMLRGFGIENALPLHKGGDIIALIESGKRIDLLVCEAVLSDMSGTELVSWVRRHRDPALKCIPVVILTGHTESNNVLALRDSGANGIIKKPIAPTQLFDRITWAANSQRQFVETASYVGPDRRFRNIGPPGGVGRRATDLSATIGEACAPNLSQDEIDSFMVPTKMVIE